MSTRAISGSLSMDGRRYHITDDTYDEPVMIVRFYDEEKLTLTKEQKDRIGKKLFNAFIEEVMPLPD